MREGEGGVERQPDEGLCALDGGDGGGPGNVEVIAVIPQDEGTGTRQCHPFAVVRGLDGAVKHPIPGVLEHIVRVVHHEVVQPVRVKRHHPIRIRHKGLCDGVLFIAVTPQVLGGGGPRHVMVQLPPTPNGSGERAECVELTVCCHLSSFSVSHTGDNEHV